MVCRSAGGGAWPSPRREVGNGTLGSSPQPPKCCLALGAAARSGWPLRGDCRRDGRAFHKAGNPSAPVSFPRRRRCDPAKPDSCNDSSADDCRPARAGPGTEGWRDPRLGTAESDPAGKCHRVAEVNVHIGPYLVDFLWREERLVVETDSYLYHRGEVAFHGDRVRELELMRLGYQVLRLSETQIDEEPGDVAEVLGAELGRRGS